jgi:uncharacterized membrane protein
MRALWRCQRAAVAVTAALIFPAVCGFAALAIDMGSIFLQTRQLQGDADLAALSAASDLTDAQAAAAATANANGWSSPVTTTITLGTYVADNSVPSGKRFTTGGTSPNAVQVTLSTKAELFFGASILGVSSLPITRTATAATAQMAAFSIGAGLASLQGGVANSVLGALTGSQVSLSVMDYNALATANVDLLQYSQALQTDLSLQGVSYNQVLSGQVSQSESLKVLGNLLTSTGQAQAGSAMQELAQAASNSTPAQLGQVIDLGPYGNQDHEDANSGAGISVNALSLATAMLELANGNRQVQLSLGSTVPGLESVTLWLAIGQRPNNSPWIAVADDGSVVISTAQARIYIDAQLAPGALSSLGLVSINVPLYVEIASGQAKLSSLTCPSATAPESVTLSVNPSVGELALGQINTSQLNNFSSPLTVSPANLVTLPLVSVTGTANVNLGGADWQPVTFSASDIQSQTVKTVSTTDIAEASVASLLSSLNLQVTVAGLGLGLGGGAISSNLQSTLTGAAGNLDTVVDTATNLLGVRLGTASVWVDGVRCNDAALVA